MASTVLRAVALCAFISGCTTNEVVVNGNFPEPLLDPLPITLGVIYPSAFAEHEFFDDAKGRSESDWLVKTGEAQVEFWDILFDGMFDEVVHIRDWETVQVRGPEIDGVLIPTIADLQYTIPTHTNVKIYEIWMRYNFRLVETTSIHKQEDGSLTFNPDELLADWPITAYGKTPTALLQSAEEAVNLAAVVALRDAGAHFITTFGRTPEVATWLDELSPRQASGETISGEASAATPKPTAGAAPRTGANEIREQNAPQDSASASAASAAIDSVPMPAPNSDDAPNNNDPTDGGSAVAEQTVSAAPLDSATAASEAAGSSAQGGAR